MEQLDRVFDLLSEERRRYVLYYLERRDEPVPVSEMAKKIQEWESDADSVEEVDDIDEELIIQLKHQDVPKIRDAEYIEYDPEAREIAISGMPAEVKVLLSVTEAIERPAEDDIATLREQ